MSAAKLCNLTGWWITRNVSQYDFIFKPGFAWNWTRWTEVQAVQKCESVLWFRQRNANIRCSFNVKPRYTNAALIPGSAQTRWYSVTPGEHIYLSCGAASGNNLIFEGKACLSWTCYMQKLCSVLIVVDFRLEYFCFMHLHLQISFPIILFVYRRH